MGPFHECEINKFISDCFDEIEWNEYSLQSSKLIDYCWLRMSFCVEHKIDWQYNNIGKMWNIHVYFKV